ncbi:histidine kinase dimerization/phosphoacceptor domain -containing protein [soil metagenome]
MTHRILYVDDDEILVRLVRKVLRRAGMEIVHAEDAGAALTLVEAEPVDAIVLDHFLRQGTGRELLVRLRAAGLAVPVVYVTASSDANVAVEALKAGAADYVMKSSGDEFLVLLERALRQSIANAELQREKQRADAELRRAKERAEALLVEVNHRVANSLMLVTSLLRLQAAACESEELKAILSQTCGRIAAIINVHRSLYQDEDVREVRMDRYLHALVADLSQTLPEHIRLDIEADPITVTSERAVATGIIVTELVANAAKYAYPGGRPGAVRVRLRRAEAGSGSGLARIAVEDDGIGAENAPAPAGTGLGQRIVRSMAASLGSELHVGSGASGTRAEVVFETGAGGAAPPVASVA